MALSWRTGSTTGAPTFARHAHTTRPARCVVRVSASIVNPHSILGVSPTADVKEVKRAYRKLALQYHPDVCKSEDGHQRFMALTQAYEMLLGRAEGKTDPNHASASGWDFHDWYWNFRMQRSWEKQQRQAKAAAAAATAAFAGADPSSSDAAAADTAYSADGAGEPGCGRRAAPHAHAGYKQPEARANLRSQLAGLRHRAAVRANRPPTGTSASSASGSWTAASGCSMDEPENSPGSRSSAYNSSQNTSARPGKDGPAPGPVSEQHHQPRQQQPQPQQDQKFAPSQWAWSWTWDDTLELSDDESAGAVATGAEADAGTATADGPAAAAVGATGTAQTAAGAGLHHQYTHVYHRDGSVAPAAVGTAPECMAVHDGHLGTVVANHAVPFPSGLGQQVTYATSAAPPAHPATPTIPQHPQQHLQRNEHNTHAGTAVMSTASHSTASSGPDTNAEPEPFSNPFTSVPPHQRASQARRRGFNADSATRDAVSHQLTGLRRKAAMKVATTTQWGDGGGSGSDTGL